MAEIVKLKRKPRPLRSTYSPAAPYVVLREDQEDGSITYDVMDHRPDSYRLVCQVSDEYGENGYAQHDADQIARGLNMLVQYGKEALPNVKDAD